MRITSKQRSAVVRQRWDMVRFALGGELQRVLRTSGVSQQEFAKSLSMEPETLRRLIAATATPRTLDVADAALRCSELRTHADTLGLAATHAYVLRGERTRGEPGWLSRVLHATARVITSDDHERQLNRGDRAIEFQVVVDGAALDFVKLRCQESGEVFTPAPEVAADLWRSFYRIQEKAFQSGRDSFYFKPLARLAQWPTSPHETLSVGKSFYGLFAVTNIDADYRRKTLDEFRLRRQDLNPQFFANPLNVIGVIVTKDGFTFLPLRGSTFEGTGRRQASVGGAVSFKGTPSTLVVESPIQTFRREVHEEWNIDIGDASFESLCIGLNLRTGEPDVLVLANTSQTAFDIQHAFSNRQTPHELSDLCASFDFRGGDLKKLAEDLRSVELNGPADEAAVFLALCRLRGSAEVLAAFASLA